LAAQDLVGYFFTLPHIARRLHCAAPSGISAVQWGAPIFGEGDLVSFVNVHGQTVDVEALKKAAKAKSRPRSDDAFHKGWLATGFPPQQLEDARKEHLKKVAAAAETGRTLLPWDEGRYMRDAKPTKIRSKPYGTAAAASDACDLAARTGWLNCAWSEITKGKAS
jgi:uncharacterized protein with LGFP repeats